MILELQWKTFLYESIPISILDWNYISVSTHIRAQPWFILILYQNKMYMYK